MFEGPERFDSQFGVGRAGMLAKNWDNVGRDDCLAHYVRKSTLNENGL
jgi:hypothetical protein